MIRLGFFLKIVLLQWKKVALFLQNEETNKSNSSFILIRYLVSFYLHFIAAMPKQTLSFALLNLFFLKATTTKIIIFILAAAIVQSYFQVQSQIDYFARKILSVFLSPHDILPTQSRDKLMPLLTSVEKCEWLLDQ